MEPELQGDSLVGVRRHPPGSIFAESRKEIISYSKGRGGNVPRNRGKRQGSRGQVHGCSLPADPRCAVPRRPPC